MKTYKFKELSEQAKQHAIDKERDDPYYIPQDVYDDVIGEWERKLENKGFTDPVIRFSGFHCQGDGASFTCDDILIPQKDLDHYFSLCDEGKLLLKALNLLGYVVQIYTGSLVSRGSSQYFHERSVDVDRYENDHMFTVHFGDNTPGVWVYPVGMLEEQQEEYANAISGEDTDYDLKQKFIETLRTPCRDDEVDDVVKDEVVKLSKEIYSDLESVYSHHMSDETVEDFLVMNDYDFDEDGKMVAAF